EYRDWGVTTYNGEIAAYQSRAGKPISFHKEYDVLRLLFELAYMDQHALNAMFTGSDKTNLRDVDKDTYETLTGLAWMVARLTGRATSVPRTEYNFDLRNEFTTMADDFERLSQETLALGQADTEAAVVNQWRQIMDKLEQIRANYQTPVVKVSKWPAKNLLSVGDKASQQNNIEKMMHYITQYVFDIYIRGHMANTAVLSQGTILGTDLELVPLDTVGLEFELRYPYSFPSDPDNPDSPLENTRRVTLQEVRGHTPKGAGTKMLQGNSYRYYEARIPWRGRLVTLSYEPETDKEGFNFTDQSKGTYAYRHMLHWEGGTYHSPLVLQIDKRELQFEAEARHVEDHRFEFQDSYLSLRAVGSGVFEILKNGKLVLDDQKQHALRIRQGETVASREAGSITLKKAVSSTLETEDGEKNENWDISLEYVKGRKFSIPDTGMKFFNWESRDVKVELEASDADLEKQIFNKQNFSLRPVKGSEGVFRILENGRPLYDYQKKKPILIRAGESVPMLGLKLVKAQRTNVHGGAPGWQLSLAYDTIDGTDIFGDNLGIKLNTRAEKPNLTLLQHSQAVLNFPELKNDMREVRFEYFGSPVVLRHRVARRGEKEFSQGNLRADFKGTWPIEGMLGGTDFALLSDRVKNPRTNKYEDKVFFERRSWIQGTLTKARVEVKVGGRYRMDNLQAVENPEKAKGKFFEVTSLDLQNNEIGVQYEDMEVKSGALLPGTGMGFSRRGDDYVVFSEAQDLFFELKKGHTYKAGELPLKVHDGVRQVELGEERQRIFTMTPWYDVRHLVLGEEILGTDMTIQPRADAPRATPYLPPIHFSDGSKLFLASAEQIIQLRGHDGIPYVLIQDQGKWHFGRVNERNFRSVEAAVTVTGAVSALNSKFELKQTLNLNGQAFEVIGKMKTLDKGEFEEQGEMVLAIYDYTTARGELEQGVLTSDLIGLNSGFFRIVQFRDTVEQAVEVVLGKVGDFTELTGAGGKFGLQIQKEKLIFGELNSADEFSKSYRVLHVNQQGTQYTVQFLDEKNQPQTISLQAAGAHEVLVDQNLQSDPFNLAAGSAQYRFFPGQGKFGKLEQIIDGKPVAVELLAATETTELKLLPKTVYEISDGDYARKYIANAKGLIRLMRNAVISN
ncbi:MAG: hypothetical protein HGA76_09765, partial [Candidatus Firestonebacteria bacterium]|nr:hypothetical protein [Candidatus Firestonebacteria bacterium]